MRDKFEQVASETPFDNSTNGFVADNVQDVIEELKQNIESSARAFIFCEYNGNANSGRYLEFFSGISSNDAPVFTAQPLDIIEIVARTTSTNATCTIGFYDISTVSPTLLYTITFNLEKQVTYIDPIALFTLPVNGELAIKVDSGSIAKPHLYFIIKGA